ncbi:cadherin domain-containing protein [Rhodopirellula sallentina]|uniref:Outer membrane adhesin like protein n=1 Tax=Rhodopirellula sallentina SM41 TaxID=1263870 RepID=M5UK41_9BACT|nr:cadherin domain-containing protein [Rhodopirellula sallentina]EMI56388.1 outer membrane adhesin like protein [Rhodopirellula sallentina SM41]
MNPTVQSLFSRLTAKRKRSNRATHRSTASKDRQLRLESLESRRVLAATIASFTPTPSGFTAELSEQISTQELSLYDNEAGDAGAADVTLQGATTGSVSGSLVVNGTSVTFVATGGPLAADTYTVTLRSADDAFKDLDDGELLDGDDDGTAGGNYVTTFVVTNDSSLVVGMPDLVRGPTQSAQGPASGSGAELPAGLPIQLSDADGVTSVTLTIEYDPTLLDVSAVQLGEDAPTGSQVEANLDTPGLITVSFFSLDAMESGQADIINIIATVPEDAAYGSVQTLQIGSVEVNAGAMSATSDDAIQVVAFAGDVNANRRYDAEDARLVARVGVDLDSGFVVTDSSTTSEAVVPFAAIDPVLLGDVTGVDGISPLDASDLLRRVVDLSTPNIPPLPDAQAPIDLALSSYIVEENLAVGSTVGTFTTTDPDANDTHTYALVAGTGDDGNSAFSISGNSLVTAEVFDASVQDSYTIRVQTTDSTGRTLERVFTISVTALNLAPTTIALSNSSVAENAAADTTVGTLSTTDPNTGDTFTYSIVSVDGSTTDTTFGISGDSLVATQTLDFETKDSYSVTVRSTDQGGLSVDETFSISVLDANDDPTAITLSDNTLADDAVAGSVVGTLTTTDVDTGDSFTYSLVSGDGDDDNASFSIVGDQLQAATTIDFSSQSSYSVRVRTTDSDGGIFEQSFSIVQSNEGPTAIALSDSTIAENGTDGNVVGAFTTTDPTSGDTFTYTLVSGDGDDDNASFVISGNELQTVAALDAETQGSLTVRVRSTDSSGEFIEESFVITVSSVNEAPTAISLSGTNIANGQPSGTFVGTLSTDDPDVGDTITYSFVSGDGDTDNASFTISGNELVSAFVADQQTQSSYSIRVLAQDSQGLSTQQTFTINISETNVGPTAVSLSNSTVAENADAATVVGAFSTTDANASDTFTYTLVSGTGDTDNALFAIDGDSLVTGASFDFESQASYSIRVQSSDPFGLVVEDTFTITVTDVNDAPTAIAIDNSSVAENSATGTVVGGLTTTDDDASDTFAYALVSGEGDTDNSLFAIDGSNLVTGASFDFESQSSYSVRVQSTDSGGASVEQVITVAIVDVNETPTAIAVDNLTVVDDSASGTIVGGLSTTDPDASDSFTYSLVAGEGDTDNGSFAIDGNNLVTAAVLDSGTQSSYSVRVRSTDAGGEFVEQVFTVTVSDGNSVPTAIAIDSTSVDENAAAGTTVGTLSTTDSDVSDTFTYSLVSGDGDADNTLFAIDGSNLTTASVLNFETQDTYSVRVRSTDGDGAFVEQTFSISVNDLNDAPTELQLDNATINEDAAVETVVGGFHTTDEDAGDTFTYALVSGEGDADNASFEIDNANLVTATTFDINTQASYSVRVQSTDDSGATIEQVFVVTVTAGNQAPTTITLDNASVAENAAVDTIVGVLGTTDADASDTFTYTLVSGDGDTDNASFSIDGNNLVTAAAFDFETQSSYSVRIRSTDSGDAFVEQSFVISVTDINDVPVAVVLDNATVSETATVGAVVGGLTTTDEDSGDSFTYSLVSGDGDTDNASFAIDGDNLITATTFDIDTQSTYSVRIQSSDLGGAVVEQVFTITVTDTNVAPTAITLDDNTIEEDAVIGAVIGGLTTTDGNASDTFTYSLVSGEGDTDNASFAIVGSNVVTAASLDFETQSTHSIRVRTTDSGGEIFEQPITISVIDVNEAPTSIMLAFPAIASGEPSGTLVGILDAVDPDAGDTFTYSFASGDGDLDNDKFTLDEGELRTAEAVDQSIQALYSIRVRVEDSEGLFFEDSADLIVTEANVAPTSIELDNDSVSDGSPAGTVVGSLTAIDTNLFDEHVFTLVSGDGDTDNASFTIVDGQLQTNFVADESTQSQYSIRVLAEDRYGLTVEQTLTINVTVL